MDTYWRTAAAPVCSLRVPRVAKGSNPNLPWPFNPAGQSEAVAGRIGPGTRNRIPGHTYDKVDVKTGRQTGTCHRPSNRNCTAGKTKGVGKLMRQKPSE
jgi:hypothetical protein